MSKTSKSIGLLHFNLNVADIVRSEQFYHTTNYEVGYDSVERIALVSRNTTRET
jgi:hypothetical protein